MLLYIYNMVRTSTSITADGYIGGRGTLETSADEAVYCGHYLSENAALLVCLRSWPPLRQANS